MEKIDGLKLKKYIEMNFEKTLKVMRNMSKRLLSDYKTILSIYVILITCSQIYLINRTHNVYGYVFCCAICNILFFRWLVVV